MDEHPKKTPSWEGLPEEERIKYEIAQELGLPEQVRKGGWKSLSAKETGRIGGLMTRRKREKEREKKNSGR